MVGPTPPRGGLGQELHPPGPRQGPGPTHGRRATLQGVLPVPSGHRPLQQRLYKLQR